METHQFFDGNTWSDFVPPMTFPMASTDIHFFHRPTGGSYLQVSEGATTLKLFIQYPFSLNAEEIDGILSLIVGEIEGPNDADTYTIDFSESKTGLMIARNAGGIGIADIRDNALKLKAVVFDLKEIRLFSKIAQVGTSEVLLKFTPRQKITRVRIP